jgi:hypothetical protein
MEAKITSVLGERAVQLDKAPEAAVLQECLNRGAVHVCVGSTSIGSMVAVGERPFVPGNLVPMDAHWLIGVCSLVEDMDTNFVAIVESGRMVQADRLFQSEWRLQGWWPDLGEVP